MNASESFVEISRNTANRYATDPPQYKQASDYEWLDPPDMELTHVPQSALTFNDDYNHVPLNQCGIVLCKAAEPWHLPAHLLYTMDGEAYEALEEHSRHVAALRWLGEHFGVRLVGVCDRTVDLLPTKRPRDKMEAMQLAVMVNSYANNPAGANVNADVPDFAAYLLSSPIWSLSWND